MWMIKPAGTRLAGSCVLCVVVVMVAACRPAPPQPPEPAPAPGAPAAPGASSAPSGPAAVVAQPVSAPVAAAVPGRINEITFDNLKLPIEKGQPFTPAVLPEGVKTLQQQRIRIRGYMLPSFQQKGLTQFVLVRDNQECCFGPGAALHDCVVVRMVAGRTADFSIRPVAVTGLFRVEELRGPGGGHLAIYALDGEEVR